MKNLLIYGTLTGNTENVAQQIKTLVEESAKELEIKFLLIIDKSLLWC